MKYFFKNILPFLFIPLSYSQNAPTPTKNGVQNHEPFFPKGETFLFEYINNNIVFESSDVRSKLGGNLVFSFDVKPDSNISNVSLIHGLETRVDEQVKSLLAKLKFAPAIQNGVKIKMNMMMTFPITAH